MDTAKGLIYGAKSDGSGHPQVPPEPDLPPCGEEGVCCEAMDDDSRPCGHVEVGCAGTDERGERRARRNGEVWWTDYEEPDKPIPDFTAREVGIHGEALAARYLTKRGMRVLQQNWRSKAGEVDIVAEDENGEIALVEVKTRLDLDGDPQCMPELAVDGRKQRRYRKIALVYLMLHPEVLRMRFDVIAINILDSHNARLRHLVGAFCWDS